jgi:hypothetical protein
MNDRVGIDVAIVADDGVLVDHRKRLNRHIGPNFRVGVDVS